ncbi:MAG: hypothetical protein CL678_15625 [Bdellovibrionaceae bacterium]|nr:hypothetical protein [Pseudobdellovibrionaceae bacterium]
MNYFLTSYDFVVGPVTWDVEQCEEFFATVFSYSRPIPNVSIHSVEQAHSLVIAILGGRDGDDTEFKQRSLFFIGRRVDAVDEGEFPVPRLHQFVRVTGNTELIHDCFQVRRVLMGVDGSAPALFKPVETLLGRYDVHLITSP